MKQLRWYFRRVLSDHAAVYLEYTLLFALFAVMVCAPLVPGGALYTLLHKELVLRVFLIALPIF